MRWMMRIWSLSTSSQQQNILTHRDRTLQFCSGSRSDSSSWIIFKQSVLADSCLLCFDEQHFDVCPAYLWDWLEVWNTAGWRGWVSDSFLAEDSTLRLPEPGGEQRVQECVRPEQGGWDYGFFLWASPTWWCTRCKGTAVFWETSGLDCLLRHSRWKDDLRPDVSDRQTCKHMKKTENEALDSHEHSYCNAF